MKFVVAITGASGVVYGKRLLEILKERDVETYLVTSRVADEILESELGIKVNDLKNLAKAHYLEDDLTAPITSGSFLVDGMIIVPCSMKTLAGIASGFTDNVVLRAADVVLKEHRRLILVPRETPLNPIHLENMLKLARLGVTILPAMPAFYHRPRSIDDLVDFVVGKILDSIGVEHNLYQRWMGGVKE